jgi:hypothetical protein
MEDVALLGLGGLYIVFFAGAFLFDGGPVSVRGGWSRAMGILGSAIRDLVFGVFER